MRKKKVAIPDALERLYSFFSNGRYYDAFYLICEIRGIAITLNDVIQLPIGYSNYVPDIILVPNRNSRNGYDMYDYDGYINLRNHRMPIRLDIYEDCSNHRYWHPSIDSLIYFTENAECFTCDFSIHCRQSYNGSRYVNDHLDIEIGEWAQTNKLFRSAFIINSKSQVQDILEKTNKYGYDCCISNNIPPADMIVFPSMEQLVKAGYTFMFNMTKEDIPYFNRLVRNGKSIKEIFKCSKAVYSVLKEENDLKIWELFRKMEKTGKIKKEDVERAYAAGYDASCMRYIYEILGRTYKGNLIFTFNSLQLYLDRLDMNEALEGIQALQYLKDYLYLCHELNVQPKIDSDSLRREHDVLARLCSYNRHGQVEIREACKKLSRFNYSEDVFFVRAITDYEDLAREARQQRNCVAGYARSIAEGRSKIFVMRMKQRPDKSLVTIEIDDNGDIRQALCAGNRRIHNRAQSEFLKRWTKFVKAEMAKKKKTA